MLFLYRNVLEAPLRCLDDIEREQRPERQPVVLTPADWPRWLDPATPEAEVLRPSPAGTLQVERMN